MTRFRSTALLTLSMLLSLATQAAAQAINSPYRFIDEKQAGGAWVGYLVTSEGALGLAPKSGPVIGGRYTIRLSGPFVVEADIGLFNSTRSVRDTVVVDSARRVVGEADFTAFHAIGSLRFNITGPRTWHSLQPFVLFGAGGVVDISPRTDIDDDVSADARFEFGTSFAGQLGGGIEWFPSRRITVRVDARNLLWKITTPTGFLLGEFGARAPGDEWLQNGQFTAGISLHF
jgi:opacity protein-like surface antigen